MKIVILGAGAIGSLFGGLLAKNNDVVLVGRKPHVNIIKKNGLTIKGKTRLNVKVKAVDTIKKIFFSPDLLILTVKSYDTLNAIKQAKAIINDSTIVISLQNGLDNVERIEKHVKRKNIVVGITTHGAVFSKPGFIEHTGISKTTVGELSGKKTRRIQKIVEMFNVAGVKTTLNNDILREIWIKAIVNSSINSLTAFSQCRNGYLLENPVLEKLVDKVCEESTCVAVSQGVSVSYDEMIKRTREVIWDTAGNFSSMLQSVHQRKFTEIDSINGVFVNYGRKNNIKVLVNEVLLNYIKSL
jgi:2-dehydropantoate 2-reductase